jgi:hypothetical protein
MSGTRKSTELPVYLKQSKPAGAPSRLFFWRALAGKPTTHSKFSEIRHFFKKMTEKSPEFEKPLDRRGNAEYIPRRRAGTHTGGARKRKLNGLFRNRKRRLMGL